MFLVKNDLFYKVRLTVSTLSAISASAIITVPIQGAIISPADPHIQYAGRISFANPERPAWNFPGIQIMAAFEGTSLRMMAKPQSGYFMAQIDEAEPFKVAFRGERDSVVTLATALPEGRHFVHLMYIIEGYELFPEFWGFVLDKGRLLVEAPAFPSRKIEFIGNSITCGYGNEGLILPSNIAFRFSKLFDTVRVRAKVDKRTAIAAHAPDKLILYK